MDESLIFNTCKNCSTTIQSHKQRTICPNCGSLFGTSRGPPTPAQQIVSHRLMGGVTPVSSAQSPRKVSPSLSVSNDTPSEQQETEPIPAQATKESNGNVLAPSNHLPPLSGSMQRLSVEINPSPRSPSPQIQDGSTRQRKISRPSDGETPQKPTYEITADVLKTKTVSDFLSEMRAARESKDWNYVEAYYSAVFESFTSINLAFKRIANKESDSKSEEAGVDSDLVNAVYQYLDHIPTHIHKAVLKSMINCLLKDSRLMELSRSPHTKDDLRGYLVLIQSPLFKKPGTYVIFAHLLRQIAGLVDQDHHFMVHWFKKIKASVFKAIVVKVQRFISCRLFPNNPEDLPPLIKCSFWIPSATKVLALFNAANNFCHPNIIPFNCFYSDSLDKLNLLVEYYNWQNQNGHRGFSFCQYPFLISILAKQTILQRDSEQQMIVMARRSLVAKVQRRQLPDIGMLFLNLNVRRSHLVTDSLNEIASKQFELKKKLKVNFVGEAGLDMGGLTKEWFLLLIRQIFQEEYGMFTYDQKSSMFWFRSGQFESHQEFNLVGVLMGLAVYNSITLDIRFPPICYRKLLSPAVVPYNKPSTTVGVCPVTLTDLAQAKPDLAHGLRELLEYDGNVEEDFNLMFDISVEQCEGLATHELKRNGGKIPVTSENRKEYVQLYVDFILNKSIYHQFQAFYHGFHSVCASNALIMLRPEEVEMLVCGCPDFNIAEFKGHTVYDGYTARDLTIRKFWDVVEAMSSDMQKQLLLFATGSDRVPIGGVSELQFKITKAINTKMLPMSHTCFNQLILPDYQSRRFLKHKLYIAIKNGHGFGLE